MSITVLVKRSSHFPYLLFSFLPDAPSLLVTLYLGPLKQKSSFFLHYSQAFTKQLLWKSGTSGLSGGHGCG